MSNAEQKERAREIIKQLDALYNAKRPGGGVHGQVIGMEPWTIRTTGDGLQCVSDAQSLLDELLDPFDRRAASAQELSALPELPTAVALGMSYAGSTFVYGHTDDTLRAYGLLCRQQGGSDAARDVLAERERQVIAEGWTPEHDDEHGECSMSYAAACYTLHGTPAESTGTVNNEELWQWSGWSWFEWFKPKDRRRNLVRAGALILAEIERLDRAAIQPQAGDAKGGAL